MYVEVLRRNALLRYSIRLHWGNEVVSLCTFFAIVLAKVVVFGNLL